MVDYKDIIKSIEDIDPKYRELAEFIGVEKLVALCESREGVPLYIPSLYHLGKPGIVNAMEKDYEGGAKVENIAIKYRMALTTAYSFLSDAIYRKKKSPLDGQVSLFE